MYYILYLSEVSVSLSYWLWSYPQLSSCTVVPKTGPRSGADPRDLQKHIVHPDTVVRRRLKTHFYKSGYCCQAWTSMSDPIWPLHMTPPVLDKIPTGNLIGLRYRWILFLSQILTIPGILSDTVSLRYSQPPGLSTPGLPATALFNSVDALYVPIEKRGEEIRSCRCRFEHLSQCHLTSIPSGWRNRGFLFLCPHIRESSARSGCFFPLSVYPLELRAAMNLSRCRYTKQWACETHHGYTNLAAPSVFYLYQNVFRVLSMTSLFYHITYP